VAIMASLPLSIVGVMLALLVTGTTLNIFSMIGIVFLMGLVTKNAILLVDCTKGLRSRGLDRRQALIDAGRLRLRPILMTTAAMIFGMLPLALGLGSAGEVRAPMARTIVGGLITSTLLTLLVVPVVYTVLDDLAHWMRRRWLKQDKGAMEESLRGVSGRAAVLAWAALVLCSTWAAPAAASEAKEEMEPQILTLKVEGATPNPSSQRVQFQGRMPDGRAVTEQVAVFAKGTRVFQVIAVGDKLDAEATDSFFGSLRLAP